MIYSLEEFNKIKHNLERSVEVEYFGEFYNIECFKNEKNIFYCLVQEDNILLVLTHVSLEESILQFKDYCINELYYMVEEDKNLHDYILKAVNVEMIDSWTYTHTNKHIEKQIQELLGNGFFEKFGSFYVVGIDEECVISKNFETINKYWLGVKNYFEVEKQRFEKELNIRKKKK